MFFEIFLSNTTFAHDYETPLEHIKIEGDYAATLTITQDIFIPPRIANIYFYQGKIVNKKVCMQKIYEYLDTATLCSLSLKTEEDYQARRKVASNYDYSFSKIEVESDTFKFKNEKYSFFRYTLPLKKSNTFTALICYGYDNLTISDLKQTLGSVLRLTIPEIPVQDLADSGISQNKAANSYTQSR
jgi:hypothetical protein